MKTVNIHEAKTHLSQLLADVEQGQEVVIARAGQPIARLLPFRREKRRGGTSAGHVRFLGDVTAPLPDDLVDMATSWEIAILVELKRIALDEPIEAYMARELGKSGVEMVGIRSIGS